MHAQRKPCVRAVPAQNCEIVSRALSTAPTAEPSPRGAKKVGARAKLNGKIELMDTMKQMRFLEIGATTNAKKLWKIWDTHLRQMRDRDNFKFESNVHYAEDLVWGQQQPSGRLWSDGFRREGSDNSVLWSYWTGMSNDTRITGATDEKVLEFINEMQIKSDTWRLSIAPDRKDVKDSGYIRRVAALKGVQSEIVPRPGRKTPFFDFFLVVRGSVPAACGGDGAPLNIPEHVRESSR